MNKDYQIIDKCIGVLLLSFLVGIMSSCSDGHSLKCEELAKKYELEKKYSKNHDLTLSTIKDLWQYGWVCKWQYRI